MNRILFQQCQFVAFLTDRKKRDNFHSFISEQEKSVGVLWSICPHGVNFYTYAHAYTYVSNLRNLPYEPRYPHAPHPGHSRDFWLSFQHRRTACQVRSFLCPWVHISNPWVHPLKSITPHCLHVWLRHKTPCTGDPPPHFMVLFTRCNEMVRHPIAGASSIDPPEMARHPSRLQVPVPCTS